MIPYKGHVYQIIHGAHSRADRYENRLSGTMDIGKDIYQDDDRIEVQGPGSRRFKT